MALQARPIFAVGPTLTKFTEFRAAMPAAFAKGRPTSPAEGVAGRIAYSVAGKRFLAPSTP